MENIKKRMEKLNEEQGAKKLEHSRVEYTYLRTETLTSRSTSLTAYGSIVNGVRYFNSMDNDSTYLPFFIPLSKKLGVHRWTKSDGSGIRATFEASPEVYPGYGPWEAEWGVVEIIDDDYRNFTGKFTLYSKPGPDGSPPRLEEGTFVIHFDSPGS